MREPTTTGPDVYGPAEATELLGISRARFYQLQAGKDFPRGRALENAQTIIVAPENVWRYANHGWTRVSSDYRGVLMQAPR